MAVLPRDWLGWNRNDRVVLATLLPVAAIALTAIIPTDAPPPPDPAEFALSIDPNAAPAGVLEALPQIGPVIADRIVAAREEQPFRTVEDLDRRVRDIGPVRREQIRPFLRFDRPEPAPRP